MDGTKLKVVQLGNGVSESDVLLHDETDRGFAFMLTQLLHPEFPEPLGVFRAVAAATDEDLVLDQIKQATEDLGPGDLESLFHDGDTWTVE